MNKTIRKKLTAEPSLSLAAALHSHTAKTIPSEANGLNDNDFSLALKLLKESANKDLLKPRDEAMSKLLQMAREI